MRSWSRGEVTVGGDLVIGDVIGWRSSPPGPRGSPGRIPLDGHSWRPSTRRPDRHEVTGDHPTGCGPPAQGRVLDRVEARDQGRETVKKPASARAISAR